MAVFYFLYSFPYAHTVNNFLEFSSFQDSDSVQLFHMDLVRIDGRYRLEGMIGFGSHGKSDDSVTLRVVWLTIN